MDADPKAALEDAHFRMDELERKHDAMGQALGALVPTLLAVMGPEIEKCVRAALEAYKVQDRAEDRKLFSELTTREDGGHDQALAQALTDLAQALRAPRARTGTVNLPSGPVTMTIKEAS